MLCCPSASVQKVSKMRRAGHLLSAKSTIRAAKASLYVPLDCWMWAIANIYLFNLSHLSELSNYKLECTVSRVCVFFFRANVACLPNGQIVKLLMYFIFNTPPTRSTALQV